jgi:hypothetical protein
LWSLATAQIRKLLQGLLRKIVNEKISAAVTIGNHHQSFSTFEPAGFQAGEVMRVSAIVGKLRDPTG